jgi:hypothetical protein
VPGQFSRLCLQNVITEPRSSLVAGRDSIASRNEAEHIRKDLKLRSQAATIASRWISLSSALGPDDGVITYSGVVRDDAARTSIIESLQSVFGFDKVKEEIAVDANAGAAPWLVGLRTAVENFKTSGVQPAFNGDSLKVSGLIGESNRDAIISSLRSALGTGVVLGVGR